MKKMNLKLIINKLLIKLAGELMKEKFNKLKRNILFWFISGIVICFITIFIFLSIYNSKPNVEVVKNINKYYATWQKYDRMTGMEIHDLWNKKYHDARYKWDGNSKYNEYDCTSAVYWLFQDLGANYILTNVEELFKRLNFVSKKRYSAYEVKEGDLIIIYVGGTNWHVGIVEGKEGSIIKYMDMDVASIGAGYRQVSFGHNTIRGIYPVTFELWIGNLLKDVKTTKDMHIIIESQEVKEVEAIKEEKSVKEIKRKKEVIKESSKEEDKTIKIIESSKGE